MVYVREVHTNEFEEVRPWPWYQTLHSLTLPELNSQTTMSTTPTHSSYPGQYLPLKKLTKFRKTGKKMCFPRWDKLPRKRDEKSLDYNCLDFFFFLSSAISKSLHLPWGRSCLDCCTKAMSTKWKETLGMGKELCLHSFIFLIHPEVIIYHFIKVNSFCKVELMSTTTSIHNACYRKVQKLDTPNTWSN